MFKKWIKTGIAIGLSVFLSACISVEQEISIKLDGSGTTKIKYKVAKMMYASVKGGKVSSVSPITPEGIKKVTESSPDLELKSVKTTAQDKFVIINAKIHFKRFEALTQPGTIYQLREGPDYYEAQIRIRVQKKKQKKNEPKSKNRPLSKEEIDEVILNTLEGYKNKLVIKTPTPIIDSNADYWEGREARWEIPSSVFYKGGEDIVVWVRYKKKSSLWDRIRNIFR